jgi:hypothetical protein
LVACMEWEIHNRLVSPSVQGSHGLVGLLGLNTGQEASGWWNSESG